MAEEMSAVRVMLAAVDEQLDKGELKSSELDGPIQLLLRLDEEGLLEPYILLALADQGISQDYEPYRAEHREAIRLYLDRYAIHDKK